MRTKAALQRDRLLATDRQRAYVARKRLERVVHIDDLAVTCWCETTVIHVPRELVLEGRTDTCGLPDCNEAAA